MMRNAGTIVRYKIEHEYIKFHAELRKERTAMGNIVYRIYKVYDYDFPVCEEMAGCWSADNFDEAFGHFEKYCGVRYTEQYKDFMREYDKTRNV